MRNNTTPHAHSSQLNPRGLNGSSSIPFELQTTNSHGSNQGDPLGNAVVAIFKTMEQAWANATGHFSPDTSPPDPEVPTAPTVNEAAMQAIGGASEQDSYWSAYKEAWSDATGADLEPDSYPNEFLAAMKDVGISTLHHVAGLLNPANWQLGPSVADAADAGAKSAPSASTDALQQTVAGLRTAGVGKIFVAELHGNSRNIDAVAGVLLGATLGGKPASLYAELNADVPDDAIERAMNDPAQRSFVANNVARSIDHVAGAKGPAADRFRAAAAQPNVKIKLLAFGNPKRWDMRRFVGDKEFAVATVGLAHAMYAVESKNKMRLPWSGMLEIVLAPNQLGPPLTEEKQKDLYDGFERASAKGQTALVIQSQTWDQKHARQAVHAYYNEKGFAVLEVPLGKTGNATIIAPAGTLPMLQQVATQYAGRTYLLCQGLDGCSEKKEVHDDL